MPKEAVDVVVDDDEDEMDSEEMGSSELDAAPMSAADLAKAMVGGIPKNFRQQADMEAFYRFVNDNDLRDDALTIFCRQREEKNAARAAKNKSKH